MLWICRWQDLKINIGKYGQSQNFKYLKRKGKGKGKVLDILSFNLFTW